MSTNSMICYWPNESQTDDTLVPCDPSAQHSACCVRGESCLQSSLCYGKTGVIYRGACTDVTWNDPACPRKCQNDTPSTTNWLKQCNWATNAYNWACTGNTSVADPCTDSKNIQFSLSLGPVVNWDITGYASNTSSAQNASITNYATITSTADSGLAKAVGLGVGIPLFLLLLVATSAALWFRRKWLGASKVMPATKERSLEEEHDVQTAWTSPRELHSQLIPPPAEKSSLSPTVELNSARERAELNG